MLSLNAWKQFEPRVYFPIFSDMDNQIDFSLQERLPISFRKFLAPLYHWIKKRKSLVYTLQDYYILLFNPAYTFRGIFVNIHGKQIANSRFPYKYKSGDFFQCGVNDWLQSHGLKMQDGVFILIANHGRPDLFNSSPGNATLRVIGKNTVAGYRTGFFCRTLNDGKKHFGFTGLNPQIEINENEVASLLFINHSSDPSYDNKVNPTVRLYRGVDDFIEAPFGEILPHTAMERSITDIFPEATRFLSPTKGKGHSVTILKGASLASVHILRRPDGTLLSMDHSRPAYPNIVKYF